MIIVQTPIRLTQGERYRSPETSIVAGTIGVELILARPTLVSELNKWESTGKLETRIVITADGKEETIRGGASGGIRGVGGNYRLKLKKRFKPGSSVRVEIGCIAGAVETALRVETLVATR